jgi:DNA-binding MarR family transcriptional regulator
MTAAAQAKLEAKEKAVPWMCIPALLDDAGLRPSEFRLLCHVSRRGPKGCFDSLRTMAEICRMDKETVANALADLVNRNMLYKKTGPGRKVRYTIVHPPSMWNRASDSDPY